MEKDTDKLVLELLAKVEAKKQEIGKLERPSWLTNCTFSYFEDDKSIDKINIQTVRDVNLLIKIYAHIAGKKRDFNLFSAELGLQPKDVSFSWQGFSAEDWFADIRNRVNIIKIDNKRKEVETLEKRVNALVSPEQRRRIELESLTKEIS